MARKDSSVIDQPQAQVETPPMPPPTPPPVTQPPPPAATPAAVVDSLAPDMGSPAPLVVPPLGRVPTSWTQLVPPRTMFRYKPTHFAGPVVSGPLASPAAGQPRSAISGSAELTFIFLVDYSMGNFQLPLPLPIGAMPIGAAVGNLQAYAVAPTINLGITAGGAEVGAFPAAATVNTFASSLFATGPLPTNGQYYLNVSGNAGAAGEYLCAIRYIVPFGQWSGPA